jgi:hypothetical protein
MLAATLILAAQLTGSVVNDVAPLPGCLVQLTAPDFSRSAVSNHEGRYIFYAVPRGSYELALTLEGFETVKRTIEVADGTIALPPQEIKLDPRVRSITIVTCGEPKPIEDALVRAASEYPLLASLGNEVTEDLEAWCLARRLDPMIVLVVASEARAR